MARFSPVAIPEGLEDIWAFITFIRDPEATGQAIQYIEDLKALLAEVNEKIALAGKAEEIEALRAQTRIDADAAARRVRDASDEVATLIADAKATIDADRGDLARARDEFSAWRLAQTAAIEREQAAIDVARGEAAEAKAAGEKAQAEAAATLEAAKALQAECERRMEAFKALAG